MKVRIVVVGAGAFGTALSAASAISDITEVWLLCRDAAVYEMLSQNHVNARNLPGIELPKTLRFSADLTLLQSASIVLFAMPSQSQRLAAKELKPYLREGQHIVCCAKGLDGKSGFFLTDLLMAELPLCSISVLSGPGFAKDIANRLPTAMVVASQSLEEARFLARNISGPTFRLYASNDQIGVQLGGALKNVFAIACGIVEGAGLGDSARAALIARGLAEMSRLTVAAGGCADTVKGLSGLGDLVLTATSRQSRNFRFGLETGKFQKAIFPEGELVEGVHAAAAAVKLATQLNVEMPVIEAVTAILDGRLDVIKAIEILMTRPLTTE